MRLIRTWEELVGLENKDYRLEIDTNIGCGWIVKKSDNSKEVYLTTHTLYERNYQASTKLLVSYGFDVIIGILNSVGRNDEREINRYLE